MVNATIESLRSPNGKFHILAEPEDNPLLSTTFFIDDIDFIQSFLENSVPKYDVKTWDIFIQVGSEAYRFFPQFEAVAVTPEVPNSAQSREDRIQKLIRILWEGEGRRWDDLYEYPMSTYESDQVVERLRATAQKIDAEYSRL
jgi:hypothetical protein